MAKKDFSSGLNSLIPEAKKGASGKKNDILRAEAEEKHDETDSEEPETRATFIIKIPLYEKVKAYAYWERFSIKEVMNKALEDFFKDKKDIKPIPRRK